MTAVIILNKNKWTDVCLISFIDNFTQQEVQKTFK